MKKIPILLMFFILLAASVNALISDRLVAYYPLDNTSDFFGKYNLNNSGGVIFTPGKFGNAANFSHSNSQYLANTSLPNYVSGGNITIAVWAYANSLGHNFILNLPNGNQNINIRLGGNSPQLEVYSQAIPTTGMLGYSAVSTSKWYHIVVVAETGKNISVYLNGTLINVTNISSWSGGSTYELRIGGNPSAGFEFPFDGLIDEVYIWNRSLDYSEILGVYFNGTDLTNMSMNITNLVCSSSGDSTPPYTTDDTTPTFSLDTTIPSYCRIGNVNTTYTLMGSNRSCTSGEGFASGHVCSLTDPDELVSYNQYVYIVCKSAFNNNETTASLLMDIPNLDTNTTRAIQGGIESSTIWPGATVYENQKVYLRNLNNNQTVATVDKVAIYGNQRWILNYANDTENKTGIFNITPVVYSLDLKNLTIPQIRAAVSSFINSTKS